MQIAGKQCSLGSLHVGVSLGAWVHRLLGKLCVPAGLSSSGRRIWKLVGTGVLRAFAETPCGDLAAGVGVLEWLPLLGLDGSSLGLGEILAAGVEEGEVCSCISRHVPFGGARAPCLPELLGIARRRGRAGPWTASVRLEKSPRGSG